MAKEQSRETAAAAAEKKKLKEEKRRLKQEQQTQRREARRRAREISRAQSALEEEEEGSGLVTAGATLFIVLLWLAVVGAVIKLDLGGIGSKVMTPILKDVPVIRAVLPGDGVTETSDSAAYGGYSSLKEAVDQIRRLELELARAQTEAGSGSEELTALKAEVERLRQLEDKQLEFQRLKSEFYEEVIYADKGPGAEAFVKYYEAMDPATAQQLYKQVVAEEAKSQEVKSYAAAYAAMKPKQAAGIFEAMTDDLSLAAQILEAMSAESRGAVLGAMDPEVAAKLTKIMDPQP